MAKTCIICGGPTGSREHLFPAALGGRRTNKGIYCARHNNEYSSLAAIISEQLSIFNALIGIVGDHASETKPVTMTDLTSGKNVELTNRRLRFKDPQVVAQYVTESAVVTDMAFSGRKEAESWVLEQREGGHHGQISRQGQASRCHIKTAHKKIMLGGTEEGLRSIGYIAQTFLAHSFPSLARLPEFQRIKDYTLKNIGTGFVWWDFDPPNDLPKNKFPFGHRVIVGLNKDDGSAYARISLFSSLNFAVHFGVLSLEESQSVVTDIDPLAKSPPEDIFSWTENTAKGAVYKPEKLTTSLAEAISSGKAKECISELMRRIAEYERQTAAGEMLCKIAGTDNFTKADRDKMFADIVSKESQRVFQLMTYVANEFRCKANTAIERHLSGLLDKTVAEDSKSVNGITEEASRSLRLACEALTVQMIADYEAGVLDQDRMEMLIGGGPGAHVVGTAIFKQIVSS